MAPINYCPNSQAIKTMAHKNEEDAAAQLAQFVAELEALKRKKLKREEEVRHMTTFCSVEWCFFYNMGALLIFEIPSAFTHASSLSPIYTGGLAQISSRDGPTYFGRIGRQRR